MMKCILRQYTEDEKEQRGKDRMERKERGEEEPRKPRNKQVSACMWGKKKAFQQLADRIKARDPAQEKVKLSTE